MVLVMKVLKIHPCFCQPKWLSCVSLLDLALPWVSVVGSDSGSSLLMRILFDVDRGWHSVKK